VEPENHFRLRFLVNPAYLTARLREIQSIRDLFSRFWNILRYLGFGLKDGYYALRAQAIRLAGYGHDGYYALRAPAIRLAGYGHKGYYALRAPAIRLAGYGHDGFYALYGETLRAGRAIKKAAETAVPAIRVSWTRLVRPLWFFRDARSDAALSIAVKSFRPRRRFEPVNNPPAPLAAGAEGRPRLSWNIHLSCNYDCPYCWFHGGWETYLGKAVILSPKEWGSHWARFNERHGPAHIEIAGGEPFTYPGFADILAMLAERNTLSVSTNFAWDPSEIAGRVDPAKVGFSCSFHPKFAPSADAFAEKVLRLRKAGFHATATIVAYPPYLKRLVDWNDSFFSRGIHLTVQPFRGYWRGRYYPVAYTAAARRMFAWFIDGEYLRYYPPDVIFAATSAFSTLDGKKQRTMTDYQLDLKSTLGRLCNSGRLYGRLQFNGDMQRCSQGGYVGNFLSGDFCMCDEAQPCQFSTCECSNEALYIQGGPLGPGGSLSAPVKRQ